MCWFGPTDPIRLDTLRLLLGLTMLLYFGAWWQYAEEWLTPLGFHPTSRTLWWLPVAPPQLPVGILPWFGILFFGSIASWTLGITTRWTSWLVLICVVYVTFVDVLAAYTINKMYIIAMSVLVCVPHATYWSIQRIAPRLQSVWPIRILQMTMILLYFTCGLGKTLFGNWLQNPYVLLAAAQGLYCTDLAAWMLRTFPTELWVWMQYLALIFEIGAPLLFGIKRLRPIGLLWGLIFQLMIALTMHQLIYFSLQMLTFYILFIDPSVLHKVHRYVKNVVPHFKSLILMKKL